MDHECSQKDILKLVLDNQKEMRVDIKSLLKSDAKTQVRVSLWGGLSGVIGGMFPVLGAVIIYFFQKKT